MSYFNTRLPVFSLLLIVILGLFIGFVSVSPFTIYLVLLTLLVVFTVFIYQFPKISLLILLFGFLLNPMVFTQIIPSIFHLSHSASNALGMWKEYVLLVLFLKTLTFKTKLNKSPITTFALVFMLFGIIFIFPNTSLSNGLMGFRYYFEGMFIFFIFGKFKSIDDKFLTAFFRSFSIFAFLLGIWSLIVSFVLKFNFMFKVGYENYGGVPYFSFLLSNHPGYLRPFGTLSSPNNYGVFLAATIVLLLLFKDKFTNKLFFYLNLILQIVVLLLTFSRSSWIGILVCLAFSHMFKKPKLTRLKFVGTIYLIGAIIIYMVLVPNNFFISFINQTLSFQDTSAIGHVSSLITGIDFIMSHPLGIGLGKAGPKGYSLTGIYLNPENSFFTIGYEMGIIGMVLFIAFNLFSIMYLFKKSKTTEDHVHSKLYLVSGYSWVILVISYLFLPMVQEMEVTLITYFIAALSTNYKPNLIQEK